MDFYLNLLNDTERADDDKPSIGIILCADQDGLEVEYALRSKGNPIGVARYKMASTLPKELKGKLPTADELRAALRNALGGKKAARRTKRASTRPPRMVRKYKR